MPQRERTVRRTPLSLDEAAAIARHAHDGRLDLSDPEVRRVVGQANRTLVRSEMWGAGGDARQRRSRRLLAVGAVVLVAVWLAGLFVPLLVRLAE